MNWISVKDRLPSREGLRENESVYVLVWEKFTWFSGGEASICGFAADGWDRDDNFGSVRPENITHWMPLPEAPAEDE